MSETKTKGHRGRGRPPVEANRRYVGATTLTFAPEVRDMIRECAAQQQRTVANWIRVVCERAARAQLEKAQEGNGRTD